MKFVDTSWWVAITLPNDFRHGDASGMIHHIGSSERILTTNLVLGESWTLLRRRDVHPVAVDFMDRIEKLRLNGTLTVHRVTPEQEAQAWVWLRRHDEREYSFVDATSFQVMRDRRMREALAFDQDFASAGFIELRP